MAFCLIFSNFCVIACLSNTGPLRIFNWSMLPIIQNYGTYLKEVIWDIKMKFHLFDQIIHLSPEIVEKLSKSNNRETNK